MSIASDETDPLCTCGHPRTAHEHYRPGTECSLCPLGGCTRFKRDKRRPKA